MTNLTKQERLIAYRIVDEVLSRPIPAVVFKHHSEELQGSDLFAIEERALHILKNLREDAKDLWKES